MKAGCRRWPGSPDGGSFPQWDVKAADRVRASVTRAGLVFGCFDRLGGDAGLQRANGRTINERSPFPDPSERGLRSHDERQGPVSRRYFTGLTHSGEFLGEFTTVETVRDMFLGVSVEHGRQVDREYGSELRPRALTLVYLSSSGEGGRTGGTGWGASFGPLGSCGAGCSFLRPRSFCCFFLDSLTFAWRCMLEAS
jgi:hypothetical protein